MVLQRKAVDIEAGERRVLGLEPVGEASKWERYGIPASVAIAPALLLAAAN